MDPAGAAAPDGARCHRSLNRPAAIRTCTPTSASASSPAACPTSMRGNRSRPAIFFVYAFFWRLWPHDSMVAAADLVAAGLRGVAARRPGPPVVRRAPPAMAPPRLPALGDPGLQRLSGLMVRAQCETFIALAVTMALVADDAAGEASVAPSARGRMARGGRVAEIQRDRLRAADWDGGGGLAAANAARRA